MTNKMDVVKAINLLKQKCNVIPEKYCIYNSAYLFLAYPKGIDKSEKKDVISPYYMVDMRSKSVGPFSPVFDLKGFFEAAKNFKDI